MAQALEHVTPQQVLDVSLHDGAIRQDEAKSAALERRDSSDAEHGPMLAQRFDPPQGQAGPSQFPVVLELGGME